jgi:hypothetical protein
MSPPLKALSAALAMLVLAGCAAGTSTRNQAPSPTPSVSWTPAELIVNYQLRGAASSADITYKTPTGTEQQQGVDVPMTREMASAVPSPTQTVEWGNYGDGTQKRIQKEIDRRDCDALDEELAEAKQLGGRELVDWIIAQETYIGCDGLELTGFGPGDFVYFSAQNTSEYGTLTCTIKVGGVPISENTATGAYAIATCEGRVP